MNHLKRILLVIATVFCVMVPALFLTACGGDGAEDNGLSSICIKADGDYATTSGSIFAEYGLKAGDINKRFNWVFIYKKGTQKSEDELSEAEKAEISDLSYSVKYYVGTTNSETGEYSWSEISENDFLGSNPNEKVLDVGNYRISWTIGGHEIELQINIATGYDLQTSYNFAVMPKTETNYNNYYNGRSEYKFGCPTYKVNNDANTYTSDYKVYVFDKNNQPVTGTKVRAVYAMPLTAPEDYDFIWYEDGNENKFEIKAGDDLLEKYNELMTNESDSAWTKWNNSNTFINYYTSAYEITCGGKVSDADENALVVNTENLSVKPGKYYLIAYYSDKNHSDTYTAPAANKILTVKKGNFIWENTLIEEVENVYHDWDKEKATNFINHELNLSLDYWYDGTKLGKITVDDLDLEKIRYDSTNMKSMTILASTGLFSNVRLEFTGKKYEHGDFSDASISELDCSNDGIQLQARLVLDDELKIYYEAYDDGSPQALRDYFNNGGIVLPVTVNLNRGIAYKPTLTNGNSEFTWDSERKAPEITNDTASLFDIVTGSVLSTANVGEYHITYKLKDNVNYYIYDNNSDEVTINWAIRKINLDNLTMICNYNNQPVSIEDENGTYYPNQITYIRGAENKIIVTLTNDQLTLINDKISNLSVQFTLSDNQTNEFINPVISREGVEYNQFILTFDGCTTDRYNILNIDVQINATSISDAYEHMIQIIFHKADYTDAELVTIFGDGSRFAPANENYHYEAVSNIRISEVTKIVPADAAPETDESITNEFGHWEIYYHTYNEDSSVKQLVTPGTTALEYLAYKLTYHFVPNDSMYATISDIDVPVEWYKEDIPVEVLTTLHTEFNTKTGVDFSLSEGQYVSEAIFNIYANDSGYGCYDILPAHDNDTEGAFKGTWVLRFDFYSGETLLNADIESGAGKSYGNDGVITQELLEDSNRNWRVVFKPDNYEYHGAYKELEIKVNVSVNVND